MEMIDLLTLSRYEAKFDVIIGKTAKIKSRIVARHFKLVYYADLFPKDLRTNFKANSGFIVP